VADGEGLSELGAELTRQAPIEMAALPHLNALLTTPPSGAPEAQLAQLLEATLELVELPDNDFSWSSWRDATHASGELGEYLAQVRSGRLPSRLDLSVIFATTGPLQELSLSSGWADAFLKLADRFDSLESKLW